MLRTGAAPPDAAAPMRPPPAPCRPPRRRRRRRAPTGARSRKLLPYLWRYRWRVGIALAFMVGGQAGQRRRAAAAEATGGRA
ncbi:MAG: hypothetical protein MZW92_62640 [Comamonadaceae bacterium]|nr:hypothetical protein [Comamonadaceae bacterium]